VPIFATILGAILLREGVGVHRWAAVLTGFVGVLIVARPGGGHFPLQGTAVGLMAAFLVALIAIQLRALGRTEPSGTTVFWFSLLSVPIAGVPYAFFAQPHDATTWALLIALGVVGGIGQLALTASLRFAPVSVVVPMDYSSLIWATLYGWLIFSVLPTSATWLGAPVIIASGLYIVWREHRRQQEKPAEPAL
jgi:drug/metabolite transporter (DMT)-like permease